MIFKTTSKKILGVLLCLLFLIIPQLNIDGYVNSTITSKFIYFSYACSFIMVVYTIMFLFKKQVSFSFTKIDVFLLFLLIYISINRYFIQEFYGFSIRYMELMGLSVLYVVLRSFTIKYYVWFLFTIIISGTIQAIYGNLQLLEYYPSNHSGFKMTGSFFNPGPYAGFLASVWPLALGIYLFREQLYHKLMADQKLATKTVKALIKYSFEYIPLLGVISIALVLPASQSRAAWLAVLCSSLLLLELRYQILRKLLNSLNSTKKTALVVFALIIVSTTLFGIYHLKKGSSDGRLFIWKVSTNIIADNPFFGVGFDRFKAHYMNYQGIYFKEYGDKIPEVFVADNTSYAFNEFLQFFVENGVLGVVIVLGIILALLKIKVSNEDKIFLWMAVGCLLSLCVFSFFSYSMQILPIKLIGFFALCLLINLKVQQKNVFLVNTNNKIVKFVFGLLFLGITTIAYKETMHLKKLSNGFEYWNQAMTNYNYGWYEDSVEGFEKAEKLFYNNGDFLMNYGKALTMFDKNKQAIKVLEQAKFYVNNTILETSLGDAYKGLKKYDLAETPYKKSYNMVPSRFYPLYLLANLYVKSEQLQEARNMAEYILNKEVKIPSTAIEEIQEEMKKTLTKYKTSGF